MKKHILDAVAESHEIVEYLGSVGPRVFVAPLSHVELRQEFVASLLRTKQWIVWRSSRDTIHHPWNNNGLPAERPPTLLTPGESDALLRDLADASPDGVGRDFQIASMTIEEPFDATSFLYSFDQTIQTFLMTGHGLEWLVHQPGDTWESIFVSRTPSLLTERLLGSDWGLFANAKKRTAPRWVKQTIKTGHLPP